MIGSIEIKIMGETKKVSTGITYYDLAKDYQDRYTNPILLVKVGNTYKELNEYVSSGDEIEFIDLKDSTGNKVYVNSLILLLSYATSRLFGYNSKISVKFSIDKGIYIVTNFELTDKKLSMIKDKMK